MQKLRLLLRGGPTFDPAARPCIARVGGMTSFSLVRVLNIRFRTSRISASFSILRSDPSWYVCPHSHPAAAIAAAFATAVIVVFAIASLESKSISALYEWRI